MMKIINYNPQALESLTEELIEPLTGRIKLLSAAYYKNLDPELLMCWCNRTARYTIPTIELVNLLKTLIGGRSAIEIGSGNGDLAYHLGIRETDSYCQQREEVRYLYTATGQIPTHPPLSTEKIDANEAVKKYRLEVIIGSWITHRYQGDASGGSVFGVNEENFIGKCTYIHLGNSSVHGGKRINKFPHKLIRFDGYITRSQRPDQNIIQIWEK